MLPGSSTHVHSPVDKHRAFGLSLTAGFGLSKTEDSAYQKPGWPANHWPVRQNQAPSNYANRRILRILSNPDFRGRGALRFGSGPGAATRQFLTMTCICVLALLGLG